MVYCLKAFPEAYRGEQLTKQERREAEAIRKCISYTLHTYENGDERIRLIEMVYFKQTHAFLDACHDLYISDSVGNRWKRDFIYNTAHYLDLR